MVIAGLANTKIQCSHVEMLRINPPVGQTCAEYLGAWIEVAGGYLKNPSAKGDECSYCPVAETNTLLKNMGIDVESRWNNFGYLTVYVTFNVLATFAIYWVARGRR